METTRQQKISRLIQKELSDIFQKQTKGMNGVLVSVSTVRISPDMSICRAYLSHQLRIIPELKFFLDDSLDYIDHIDALLKQ